MDGINTSGWDYPTEPRVTTDDSEPRVRIFITVEADDVPIFTGEYLSVESMIEDSYKAEKVIEDWESENV